jgi:branched-subunit amino acid aminotransferase/4-amino-4-deoxychorismate lyase
VNHAERLRQLADRMGLDGYAEELREIAVEMEAQPPAQAEREAWIVTVRPVSVEGEPDAHCVKAKVGNQTFTIGPDYSETKGDAEVFAACFEQALKRSGATLKGQQ